MGDWQELSQTLLIALLLSFLIAKLISLVLSTAHPSPPHAQLPLVEEQDQRQKQESVAFDNDGGDDNYDDDDDWEGVESTELDEEFSAATAFVAATVADQNAIGVAEDVQLQMYGLYKIATEGPCTAPQPSLLKMKARAKWNAWQKLGTMSPEEAMEKYITIVTQLYPSWSNGSSAKRTDKEIPTSSSSAKGAVGPVFSSFLHEEESGEDISFEPIHISAREGKTDELLSYVANGVSINLRDGEGRTPLHWAVDRGHYDVVEALVTKNADVNAKDNEGQTPLHYAAICDRESIAELLFRWHADPNIKDEDDNSALDLGGSRWAFIIGTG